MKDIAEKSLFIIPEKIKRLLWSFIILGIGMFIAGLMTGGEDSVLRTWQAFLINTVFWAGIAHAGIFFSVIWQLTDAKWGRPFKRLAEACAGFLPISFLMFIIVFFGSNVLYEWTHNPFLHHGVAVKAGWLNMPFFVSRNIAWLVLIYASFLVVCENINQTGHCSCTKTIGNRLGWKVCGQDAGRLWRTRR